MQVAAVAAGSLLGVGDAVAGGHEVELSRSDDLLGAERVAVHGFARQQPGDRLEADVGMGGNAEAALVDGGGTHVVYEAPGADGAAAPAWQRSSHRDGADVAGAALGDLDHSSFGAGGSGFGVGIGGGDGTTHAAGPGGRTRQMAARYPSPARRMSRSAGSPPVGKISSVWLVVSRPGRWAYGSVLITRSLSSSGK